MISVSPLVLACAALLSSSCSAAVSKDCLAIGERDLAKVRGHFGPASFFRARFSAVAVPDPSAVTQFYKSVLTAGHIDFILSCANETDADEVRNNPKFAAPFCGPNEGPRKIDVGGSAVLSEEEFTSLVAMTCQLENERFKVESFSLLRLGVAPPAVAMPPEVHGS